MIELTRDECENLLDALEEWADVVGCKDCDPCDGEEEMTIGLNGDRYCELVEKLRSVI